MERAEVQRSLHNWCPTRCLHDTTLNRSFLRARKTLRDSFNASQARRKTSINHPQERSTRPAPPPTLEPPLSCVLLPPATRLGGCSTRKSMQLATRGRAPPRPIRRQHGMGPPRDRGEHRTVDSHPRWRLHRLEPGCSYRGARARRRRRRGRKFFVEATL